MFDSSLNSISL